MAAVSGRVVFMVRWSVSLYACVEARVAVDAGQVAEFGKAARLYFW
jgi:hypothetical protein